jgi:hypothetical protein
MQDRKAHSGRFVWTQGIAFMLATPVFGQERLAPVPAAGVPTAKTVLKLAASVAFRSDLFLDTAVSNSNELPNDR